MGRPAPRPRVTTEGALPEISTNSARTVSRLVLVVVDRDSIKPADSRPIMQAGVAFVRQLASADRVGLLAIPSGPRVDFTRDHQRVGDALGGIIGNAEDLTDTPPRVSIREAFDIDERNSAEVFKSVYERECARRPQVEGFAGRLCGRDPPAREVDHDADSDARDREAEVAAERDRGVFAGRGPEGRRPAVAGHSVWRLPAVGDQRHRKDRAPASASTPSRCSARSRMRARARVRVISKPTAA
jgi:hypothetical protein